MAKAQIQNVMVEKKRLLSVIKKRGDMNILKKKIIYLSFI